MIRVYLESLRVNSSPVPSPREGKRNLLSEFPASVVTAPDGKAFVKDAKRITLEFLPEEEVVECREAGKLVLIVPLSNIAYMVPHPDQAAAETAGEGVTPGGPPLADLAAVEVWRKKQEEVRFADMIDAGRKANAVKAEAERQDAEDRARMARETAAQAQVDALKGEALRPTVEKAALADADRRQAGEPSPLGANPVLGQLAKKKP